MIYRAKINNLLKGVIQLSPITGRLSSSLVKFMEAGVTKDLLSPLYWRTKR